MNQEQNHKRKRGFILVHEFKGSEFVVGKDLETGKQVEIKIPHKSAFIVDIDSILNAEEDIDPASEKLNDFYCKLTYRKVEKDGTSRITVAHLVETVEEVYKKICEAQSKT